MNTSTYLGHGVSSVGVLDPLLRYISSTLEVKVSEVQELSCLLDVLFVVGGLLGILLVTDFLVLSGSQPSRNIGVGSKLSSLELWKERRIFYRMSNEE